MASTTTTAGRGRMSGAYARRRYNMECSATATMPVKDSPSILAVGSSGIWGVRSAAIAQEQAGKTSGSTQDHLVDEYPLGVFSRGQHRVLAVHAHNGSGRQVSATSSSPSPRRREDRRRPSRRRTATLRNPAGSQPTAQACDRSRLETGSLRYRRPQTNP